MARVTADENEMLRTKLAVAVKEREILQTRESDAAAHAKSRHCNCRYRGCCSIPQRDYLHALN